MAQIISSLSLSSWRPTRIAETRLRQRAVTSEEVQAGFYALAYEYDDDGDGNNSTIISYRGTDDFDSAADLLTSKDAGFGWTLGLGILASEQGRMAVEFYQTVTGQTADISLTGHSLGGGLSGFVGALYDKDAVVFDSMTFELAAQNATDYVITFEDLTTERVAPEDLAARVAELQGLGLMFSYAPNSPEYHDIVYDGATPWNPDLVGIEGYYVDGEVLGTMLPLRGGAAELHPPYTLGPDVNLVTGPDAIELHSQSTLVIRMYADKQGVADDWESAAQHFWPVMYDGAFAESVGASSVPGKLQIDAQAGATEKYADILRTIIAYSAIDEGPQNTEARPFGDTGIRALYAVANQYGEALAATDAAASLTTHATDISKTFVQFAGQLALKKVMRGQEPAGLEDAEQGVVNYSQAGNTLTIKLPDAMWHPIAAGVTPQSYLVQNLLTATGEEAPIRAAMDDRWGDNTVNAIDRVVFAASGSGEATVAEEPAATDKGTLFVGGSGGDTVTGSADREVLFGGAGDDVLKGRAGDDILVGGDGTDTVDYSDAASGIAIDFNLEEFQVTNDGDGGTDHLQSIEMIIGSIHGDSITGSSTDQPEYMENDIIEGKGGDDTLVGGVGDDELRGGEDTDTADYSNAASGIVIDWSQDEFQVTDDGDGGKDHLDSIEKIKGSNHDDVIEIQGTNWTPTNGVDPETIVLWEIDGGGGDGEITFSGAGGKVHGGGGDDILDVDGYAAEMYGGAGADTFHFSDNVLVGDASGDDRMTLSGLINLTGGVHWEGSENPWAYGLWGIKYGFNVAGEMVIESAIFRNAAGDPLRTYVAGVSRADVGPGSVQADRPLGLYVITLEAQTDRLLNNDLPKGWWSDSWRALLGDFMKAMTGTSYYEGVDPLVLDLDGDGVELTARSSISPRFDMDGDMFAEPSGWLTGDDGLLALSAAKWDSAPRRQDLALAA